MTLYLLPNVLGPVDDHRLFLPESVERVLSQIDGLIAESEGEGRRYLKRFATKKKPHEIPIALLTKHKEAPDFLLEPVRKGEKWGLISDCGLPCLADPGAALVRRAYELKLKVEAYAGPSSLTHGLMLSGLPAQMFAFHGYLPKQPDVRLQAIRRLEKTKQTTHLFIEAPYRNLYTLNACLQTLHPNTLLCVASSLTLPDQWIHTASIASWHKLSIQALSPFLVKQPVLFLFYAP
jgi:16S rRNA (cytidine1402-2'-O)-methyltransferase